MANRQTIDVVVDVCHACMKEFKRKVKRKCFKCMLRVECMPRSNPICTNICNTCWSAHVRVARVLHYKKLRDGWGDAE